MSTIETQIPVFTPFKQIPYWSDDEQFTMTGKQLKSVQAMVDAYSKFINNLEGFFIENLNNGKIKIKYEDLEGNEMSKEQIDAMLNEYARMTAESLTTQEKQD